MMRVDYTIPGWEPQPGAAGVGEAETRPPSFQAFLERASQPMAPPVNRLLGLNAAPPSGFTIPPPPIPASLAGVDARELRERWDNLMANHAADPESRGMMALLREYQSGDDGIRSRQLAGPRG